VGNVRLQESRVVRVIRKQLIRKSLDMLKEIANREPKGDGRDDYSTFYEAFGK
jgi:heat shock protein beta